MMMKSLYIDDLYFALEDDFAFVAETFFSAFGAGKAFSAVALKLATDCVMNVPHVRLSLPGFCACALSTAIFADVSTTQSKFS
jgi:hypothetical protein